MATGWKKAIEVLVASSGLPSVLTHLKRPSTAILAYHNIVPHGEKVAGDKSLHIDQSTFGEQLDFLQERGVFQPLDAMMRSVDASESRLRVVVTFDDAYRGTMTAGVEELEKRGIPATVFVPTNLLGTKGFWWDRLSPADSAGLDPSIRSLALTVMRGEGARILSWAESNGQSTTEMPEHAMPVSEEELLNPSLYEGMTFGAHTASHPNLAELSEPEVRIELAVCKRWLVARTDRYIDWVAFPYGLHNDAVARAASEIFIGALRVDGGLSRRRGRWKDLDSLPRLNVPRGLTLDGLALRLAGIQSQR